MAPDDRHERLVEAPMSTVACFSLGKPPGTLDTGCGWAVRTGVGGTGEILVGQ